MRMYLLLSLSVFAVLTALSVSALAQAEKDHSGAPTANELRPAAVPFDAETAKRHQHTWAKHLSAEVTVENSLGMQFILIPAGESRMLDELDVVRTKAFYLGKTEVTQGQWLAVMGTAPWKGKASVREGDRYPATFVCWNDAQEFCKRLTEKESKGTYRLPTEAEWDFACRGGTTAQFSFGDDESQLEQYAWYDDSAGKFAHEVALKKPNPFGLFDIHGNVSEWCEGFYGGTPGKEESPRPSKSGDLRVAAGGSWAMNIKGADGKSLSPYYCRSASRIWIIPSYGNASNGLRLVWSPPEDEEP